MSNPVIPIIVGITGHRAVRDIDKEVLLQAVISTLSDIKNRWPNSPIHMLNSLAEGADLLCADAAESLGIPLIVVLPTDVQTYTDSFSESDKARFHFHCSKALSVFVAPETESPSPGITLQDHQFRQAGIYVAMHSHILLALWDGDESRKNGCGTAACISFALSGSYTPKEDAPVRPWKSSLVYHVFTPRGQNSDAAGTLSILGNTSIMETILSRNDEFNRLSSSKSLKDSDSLFGKTEVSPKIQQLEQLYSSSDYLSIRYAKRYRLVLAFLALLGTILTASFLLYDEAELHWMILVTGAALLFMVLCHRYAVRSACHRRYLEYRVLAESLRVDAFLKYAGCRTDVTALMPLTQQEETPWIVSAMYALSADRFNPITHPIRDIWVDQQRAYHARAAVKSNTKLKKSDRIVQIALIATAVLYVFALVFELCFAGTFTTTVFRVSGPDVYRTVLKIVLGSISAATLFIANYYGKQSLSRGETDHIKMHNFYERVLSALDRQGQSDRLLIHLAREELIENGNWYSYQSGNTPDINL